jgi:hypothetical protein
MADLPPDLNPNQPLTKDNLRDDVNYLPIAEDTLQLQVDTLNVLYGYVAIESFTPERRKQIEDYYRFSATRQNSDSPKIAPRTTDTFDII